MSDEYSLHPIGRVESPLVDPSEAPPQGDEDTPEAWLVLDPAMREAMRDLEAGGEILVLTWLHQARRDTLVVHPRGDPNNPERGVFSTWSPSRPNPIGLHAVRITAIAGTRIAVRNLEAVDGTPILDIKPLLRRSPEEPGPAG